VAYDWFNKALNKGNKNAAERIGEIHLLGVGTEENGETAVTMINKTINESSTSKFLMGETFFLGKGNEQDFVKARAFYMEAANKKNPRAMMRLSELYELGLGVEEDLDEAVSWLHKAAQLEYPGAYLALGELYFAYEIEDDENNTQTRFWLEKAAEHSHFEAIELLHLLDEDDFDPSKYLKNINFDLIIDSARAGEVEAMMMFARMFSDGVYVKKDMDSTVFWLEKAADAGSIESMSQLGYAYHYGLFGKRDYAKANFWLKKAAALGDEKAMFLIGEQYYSGLGTKKNYTEALRWYKKAADKGHTQAMIELGSMYELGDGVQKNCQTAKIWYKKAIQNGSGEGETRLKNISCK